MGKNQLSEDFVRGAWLEFRDGHQESGKIIYLIPFWLHDTYSTLFFVDPWDVDSAMFLHALRF